MLMYRMLVLQNGVGALQHINPGSRLLSCDCSGSMQRCSADAAKVPGNKTVRLSLACQHAHIVPPSAATCAAAGLQEVQHATFQM